MAQSTGCSVAGCNRRHEARGLCGNHYMMERRRGTTAPSKRGPGQAYGAVYVKPNGYLVRKMPDHPWHAGTRLDGALFVRSLSTWSTSRSTCHST